ncbi:MAG: gephyrin-like molybdotransferase Glp [Nitrospirota bacterium]
MISVEEALGLILENIREIGFEKVDIKEALGRVLAEDVYARRNIPPWDNSAMDGYAVIVNDVEGASKENPAVLKIIESLPAGYISESKLKSGEAIKIMTGAPMPNGADAVVMVEYTEKDGGKVRIFKRPENGDHIRKAGEDVKDGQLVIKKGQLIRPSEIGMLASMARSIVSVYQRPRVAILATGDELVDLDEEICGAKIINSNTYAVGAQIQECGALPILLGIARDRQDELEEKLRLGMNADIIITSGGVSVGDYDHVKDVVKGLGGDLRLWKVAIKPGKPLAFSMLNSRPMFGLPGNPVASMVTFEIFVRPAILKMMGHKKIFRPIIDATIKDDLKKKENRRHFIRASVQSDGDGYVVETTGDQGSHMMTSMTKANGLIIFHENDTAIKAGDKVKVMLLDRSFEYRKDAGY